MAIFDGLIARYCPSLDTSGNGTTTLYNLDGNGAQVGSNNGTLTNMDAGTDWVVDTNNGGVRALDFDGVNDYVNCGTISPLNTTNITISCWVNYTSGVLSRIASRYYNTTGNNGWILTADVDGRLNFGGRNDASTYINTASSTGVITSGWQHVAAVKSGSTVTLYRNGIQIATGTFTATFASNTLQIGAMEITGSGIFYGTQKLDDICFFNVAKTPEDIAALSTQRGYLVSNNTYNEVGSGGISAGATVFIPPTIGLWNGLVTRYCPSLDTSGNGTTTLYNLKGNGTQVGSANSSLTNMDAGTDWVVDTGNGGVRALDFDGINDHITFSGTPLNGLTNFTLSFWIYRRTYTGRMRIMCATGSFGTNMQASFSFTLNFNEFHYEVESYSPFSGYVAQSLSTFTTGKWHHICVVRDSNTVKCYLNNNKNQNTGLPTGAMQATRTFLSNNDEVNSNPFDGRLDDICLFNVAKTSDDIAVLSSQRGYYFTNTYNEVGNGGISAGAGLKSEIRISNLDIEVFGFIGNDEEIRVSNLDIEVFGFTGNTEEIRVSSLDVEVFGFTGNTEEIRVSSLDVEIYGSVDEPIYNESFDGGLELNGTSNNGIVITENIPNSGVVISGIARAPQNILEIANGGVRVGIKDTGSILQTVFLDGWELNQNHGKWGNHSTKYSLNTTTGRYFGNAMQFGTNSSGEPDYLFTPYFTDDDSWLIGFNIKKSASNTSGTFLKAYDGNIVQLEFKINNNDILVYRGGSTLIHTFFDAVVGDSWQHIQIKFYINEEGFVYLRNENSHIAPFGRNLNTKQSDYSRVNRFILTSSLEVNDAISWAFDDFWICTMDNITNNAWLGALKIEGLNTDVVGYQNDWEAYGDYIRSTSHDDIISYTIDDISYITSNIKAVSLETILSKGGPCDVATSKTFLKLNTKFRRSEEISVLKNFQRVSEVIEISPDEDFWELDNFQNLEIGVQTTLRGNKNYVLVSTGGLVVSNI